jgi:hypothetical protein
MVKVMKKVGTENGVVFVGKFEDNPFVEFVAYMVDGSIAYSKIHFPKWLIDNIPDKLHQDLMDKKQRILLDSWNTEKARFI